MSSILYLLNRYVAPFAWGVCMAAATAVDGSMAAVGLIAFAGMFAFFTLSDKFPLTKSPRVLELPLKLKDSVGNRN